MNYVEFTRHIAKAGLSIKEFATLIKTNPNSLTNLSTKEEVPKNLAIVSMLLGEMVDKGLAYEHLFETLNIKAAKPRVKGTFGKKSGAAS